jgi:hypothetical protein
VALLGTDQTFVGVEQRLDGAAAARPYDWPAAYVTVKHADAPKVNMTPEVARKLAKALNRSANYIDPPKPRAKRT